MLRQRMVWSCLMLMAFASCKKDGGARPPPPPASDASTPPPPTPAGFGAIRGEALYAGKAPPIRIPTGSDPVCAGAEVFDESLIVGTGFALSNVVVALRDSPEGERGPSSARVDLAQKGCRYEPHVLAVEGGTTIVISNKDRTLHNVHTYKKNGSTWFNLAQPPGSPPMDKRANELGQLLKFKCDVHPWMTAYVLVTDHPYFAVTGADGSFLIEHVPAGKHTIETWHEKLGTMLFEITVTADTTTVLPAFVYGPP